MKRLLPILAALAVATSAAAATAVATSVEDLARTSDLVVRGRVVSTEARLSEGRIYTWVEIQVAKTLRGSGPGLVTVITPGGVVGEKGQRVYGAPTFAVGEDVVVFLGKAETNVFRVNGLAQGKFAVSGTMATPDTSNTSFVATQMRAGERLSGPMTVEELERRIGSVR